MSFTDYKVDESEYEGKDIQSIRETVITGKADWLKARFDALSKGVIIAKYNAMLDALTGPSAAAAIGSSGGTVQSELDGYTAGIAQSKEDASAAYAQAQQAYSQAAQARQMALEALERVDGAVTVDDPFTGGKANINQLLKKLYEALSAYDAAVETIAGVAEDSLRIASGANATAAQLRAELDAAITLYNPETGRRDSIQNIVYMLYGYVKQGGMTAAEFNALSLTAEEFNALELTAIRFNTEGITAAQTS